MKVLYLRRDLHSSFKVKRSKIKVTRTISADIHPAAYLPIRIYLVPLFGVFLACSILMRDRNITTEPNFQKSLSKSRILSPKNSCLSISAVYAAKVAAGGSIDSDDVSPRPLTRAHAK